MENNRAYAKKLRTENMYAEALPLYKLLWEGCSGDNVDCWLGWEYADTLKRNGKIDDAISVCKKVYQFDKEFKYNTHLLAWCLYERYIKNIDADNPPKDLKKIIQIADFITTTSRQEKGTPYEITVWAILKLLKNNNMFNAIKVDYWLVKLEVSLLSDIPYSYTDNTGKQRELASKKEEWYTTKCKVLLEMKKYKDCVDLCEEALQSIKKFHYDNNIWLCVKKAYCIGMLGDIKQSIDLLISLLTEKDHWSIHEMIFNFYVLDNNCPEGLKHAYTAALTKDPPKMKVKLFYNVGKILESLKNKNYALKHYKFCKKIREENKWNVPVELDAAIENISADVQQSDDNNLYKDLRNFWINEKLRLTPRAEGTVVNILPTGNAGFIKSGNASYYFRVQSVIGDKHKLKRDIKVSFTLIDSFDRRKNIPTKEAVDLLLL